MSSTLLSLEINLLVELFQWLCFSSRISIYFILTSFTFFFLRQPYPCLIVSTLPLLNLKVLNLLTLKSFFIYSAVSIAWAAKIPFVVTVASCMCVSSFLTLHFLMVTCIVTGIVFHRHPLCSRLESHTYKEVKHYLIPDQSSYPVFARGPRITECYESGHPSPEHSLSLGFQLFGMILFLPSSKADGFPSCLWWGIANGAALCGLVRLAQIKISLWLDPFPSLDCPQL